MRQGAIVMTPDVYRQYTYIYVQIYGSGPIIPICLTESVTRTRSSPNYKKKMQLKMKHSGPMVVES